MLYVLYCRDGERSGEIRKSTRPAHLDWAGAQACIRMAGPMLDDQGERSIGSLFVIEADSLEAARAFHAEDPYTRAGLWSSVEVHPFRWLLPRVRE